MQCIDLSKSGFLLRPQSGFSDASHSSTLPIKLESRTAFVKPFRPRTNPPSPVRAAMPAPPPVSRRAGPRLVPPLAPPANNLRLPSDSSGSNAGGSRKRVRETRAANANGVPAAEAIMRDDDDEYFDVDMDSQEAFDQLEYGRPNEAPVNDGLFVPFYPHLGNKDFDDE